ncbi:hypothetical protein X975_20275, partial [Stegodyphus mimosarum]
MFSSTWRRHPRSFCCFLYRLFRHIRINSTQNITSTLRLHKHCATINLAHIKCLSIIF